LSILNWELKEIVYSHGVIFFFKIKSIWFVLLQYSRQRGGPFTSGATHFQLWIRVPMYFLFKKTILVFFNHKQTHTAGILSSETKY